MIRALAVIVPGNNVTVRQREDTGLNVVADHDGFDVFHPVVRHLNAFSLRDGGIIRSRPTHAAASHGSALIFASRLTFAHFGISNVIRAANSSGVFATGPNPSTAPPRSAMNARRFTRSPRWRAARDRPGPHGRSPSRPED